MSRSEDGRIRRVASHSAPKVLWFAKIRSRSLTGCVTGFNNVNAELPTYSGSPLMDCLPETRERNPLAVEAAVEWDSATALMQEADSATFSSATIPWWVLSRE